MLTGLSARLLVLTIAFVMLAEVLIFAPSIARFRYDYLEERLADAHLAILALEATPDNMVHEDLELELLRHVNAYMVALKKPDSGKLMLMTQTPERIDGTYDLEKKNFLRLIGDAFATLLEDDDRVLRIVGTSPKDRSVGVEVVLDEAPLHAAMLAFSQRILALSLVISVFTAALVYLSLHWLLVRPMRHITESMISFREDPENAARYIDPSDRNDEIGVMEHELASMQTALRAALQQKTRLAALGIAVTKINHDLRNILATARLVSDRLVNSEDPEVRRVTPTLVTTIDRAVDLCTQTLNFTREGPASLELQHFDLRDLIDDVGANLSASHNGDASWRNLMTEGIDLDADRNQLFRALTNLGENAVQAGASQVDFSAARENGELYIRVSDNGPGLPPRARDKLFQPFAGSARPGGTGLGLAIARDMVRAHGGDLKLEYSTAEGTRFCMVLPSDQSGSLNGGRH
ncbi:MAG: HAMP domain-containing sensor histidine kinase [Pseudomonadota bacterium]